MSDFPWFEVVILPAMTLIAVIIIFRIKPSKDHCSGWIKGSMT